MQESFALSKRFLINYEDTIDGLTADSIPNNFRNLTPNIDIFDDNRLPLAVIELRCGVNGRIIRGIFNYESSVDNMRNKSCCINRWF